MILHSSRPTSCLGLNIGEVIVLDGNSLNRIVLQYINLLLLACLLVSQFQSDPLTSLLKHTHELCPAHSSTFLDPYAQKWNAYDSLVALPTSTHGITNTPTIRLNLRHSPDWLYPFSSDIIFGHLSRPPPVSLSV